MRVYVVDVDEDIGIGLIRLLLQDWGCMFEKKVIEGIDLTLYWYQHNTNRCRRPRRYSKRISV